MRFARKPLAPGSDPPHHRQGRLRLASSPPAPPSTRHTASTGLGRAGATTTSGHDDLLRWVSYKVEDIDADYRLFCFADEPSVLRRFNETLDFELVAARDGLAGSIASPASSSPPIEEGPPGSVLRVCYSFTSAVSVLPSVSIRDYRKHALLSVKDNSRAFELLVADECLRI
ncbi:hypothetical protein ZWY2020_021045 [Hordeum vulgare]|nr:hypothetical protein ZWY2020_021045 [Hordeum vulgare]